MNSTNEDVALLACILLCCVDCCIFSLNVCFFFTKSVLAAPQQSAEVPLPPPRSKLCSVGVSDMCHSYCSSGGGSL